MLPKTGQSCEVDVWESLVTCNESVMHTEDDCRAASIRQSSQGDAQCSSSSAHDGCFR